MTKYYKIVSWSYRILLVLITIGYLLSSLVFSNINPNEKATDVWYFLFYSLITCTTITTFHNLNDTHKYRMLFHKAALLLVAVSLVFLLNFLYMVLKNGDANLIVNVVLLISCFINATLLYYLIRDKKYSNSN